MTERSPTGAKPGFESLAATWVATDRRKPTMQRNTANPIQELIAQDGVAVSRGTHNDWVLEVQPDCTTAGPALDPVESWADMHWETFKVHELPHEKDDWTGYTANRRDSAEVSDE